MGDLDQALCEAALAGMAPAVRFLGETDSTNRVAREWASAGAPDGAVVVADHQTAGRGRLGRSWFDLPGACLLVSLVLRPGLAAGDLGLLSLAAGAALCHALGDLGLEPRVKWPNDVLLGDRKVAGILSEAEVVLGRAASVALGVGVNVNVAEADLPPEIRESATGLLRETGRPTDRADLLAGFLRHWTRLRAQLDAGRRDLVLDAYRAVCETLGRRVRVETLGGAVEGIALGLDPAGALILDGGDVVAAGDVVHLRSPG